MIVFLFGPGQLLLLKSGNSLPEITIERIEFQDGKIVALLRNTGPMVVTVLKQILITEFSQCNRTKQKPF